MSHRASGSPASIRPLGDRGVTVELGDALSPTINARVRALARRLRDFPGVLETVPTLRSVLVLFDPLASDGTHIAEAAHRLARDLPPDLGAPERVVDVPVVYGGEAGPDLEDVAHHHGLAPSDVIEVHSTQEYLVYMLGFSPGFPYLGVLPEAIRTPRLPSPRLRVPAGSVGIAGALTGIYSLQTPGGWRLIGRTPLRIYDPQRADPFLFRSGDRVRFVPTASAVFPAEQSAVHRPIPYPRRPTFEVIEPGLYTTVQDLGRPGYRSLGLPPSGAMDPASLQIGNIIVGNSPGAAVLESAVPGPVLRALDAVTVAIVGADLSPTVDRTAAELWRPVAIRPGQTIRFGAPRTGMWAYIAVEGGIDVPPVLGSASTYVPGGLGGGGGRRLRAGDVFGRGERARRPKSTVPVGALAFPQNEVRIRVLLGPQEAHFTEAGQATLLREAYRTSVHSDRVGMRLEGPAVSHRGSADLLSDALVPGVIQVPSGGQPIVIMPDGPTTGGYAKIGVVASADLRLIAQAKPGTRVRFSATTIEHAIDVLRQQRAWLDELMRATE